MIDPKSALTEALVRTLSDERLQGEHGLLAYLQTQVPDRNSGHRQRIDADMALVKEELERRGLPSVTR